LLEDTAGVFGGELPSNPTAREKKSFAVAATWGPKKGPRGGPRGGTRGKNCPGSPLWGPGGIDRQQGKRSRPRGGRSGDFPGAGVCREGGGEEEGRGNEIWGKGPIGGGLALNTVGCRVFESPGQTPGSLTNPPTSKAGCADFRKLIKAKKTGDPAPGGQKNSRGQTTRPKHVPAPRGLVETKVLPVIKQSRIVLGGERKPPPPPPHRPEKQGQKQN